MKAEWARFNKYLYNFWSLQTAVICLGLVTVPLSLLNPYLAKLIINKAYGNKDLKLFLILAIIGGSIFVLNGLVNSLAEYLSQRIKCGVNFNLTKDMFRHLLGLPVRFFKDKSTGELIYKTVNDIHSVSDFVADTVPAMATLLPRCLFILGIVFYLNWELALLATLLVPISCVSPYLFQKWLREMTRRMVEKYEGIYERLHEIFVNIHMVKALRKEDYETRRFEENLSEKMNCELKSARLLGICGLSGSFLNKVIGGVIALYGGYQVFRGTITLGSLTAVMIYMTQLLGLAKSISGFYEAILASSVSRKRLGEIMDSAPKRRDAAGAVDHHITLGRIEFRDVSFGYKGNELIMKDMNFSIEPSAKIALAGSSGCGKTTLLALILGLYEPANGSILLDGLDTRDIKSKCLQGQVGIALQEPFLWNDTVANNILYGAEQAGGKDMIKAARLAEAHDFILNLPGQYDSSSGDAACKISEGQKQRIAIARAVIGRPKILMLDEAMCSLDSETEDKIIDNLRRELAGSTIVVVSHRLSTIRKMDCVYFFEGPGKMVIGTHDGLLAQNRKYRDLLASQVA